MHQEQKELLSIPPPPDGAIYVSDQVSFRTEGTQRVISVHGVVFANYDLEDRAAEAYAMITLTESGYATQIQIARSFGYTARSLRRYEKRFEAGGIGALVGGSGRPPGHASGNVKERGRDKRILNLKPKGYSNRTIAGKLGLSEKAIRKRLRRLGWQPRLESANSGLPFQEEVIGAAASTTEVSEKVREIPCPEPTVEPQRRQNGRTDSQTEPPSASGDIDPLDRSLDRLMAAMGKLEDAAPMFAQADNVAGAGVLFAIPSLVAPGGPSLSPKLYRTL